MTAISSSSGFDCLFEAAIPEISLLGLDFADFPPEEVLQLLARRGASARFGYVVTPNADHLVRMTRDPRLRPLYGGAMLRLLDSRVVARIAQLAGLRVPPVVTGSDLTAALFQKVIAADEPVTI